MKYMNEIKPRIDPFVLVIDKDRERILNFMLQSVDDNKEILSKIQKSGLIGEFFKMMEEINVRLHERGWCEDPTCSFDYDGLDKKE